MHACILGSHVDLDVSVTGSLSVAIVDAVCQVGLICSKRAEPLHYPLLAICRLSGCTVVSGVVVVIGVCNRSQMRISKCTCLIFGVSI